MHLITFPAVAIASFPKSSNTESQINPLQDPNLTTDETNQSKPKRTCEDPGDESPDYILALKEEEMRNDGKGGCGFATFVRSKPRRGERNRGCSLHLDWNVAVVRGPWFLLMGPWAVQAGDGTALSWPSDAPRLLGSAARSACVRGIEELLYQCTRRRLGGQVCC